MVTCTHHVPATFHGLQFDGLVAVPKSFYFYNNTT